MTLHKNRFCPVVVTLFILLASCAPVPEAPVSPSLEIERTEENGREIYHFVFTAGIRNENNDTLFSDVSGRIVVTGGGKNELFTVPFSLPLILPFDTAIVENSFTRDADDARPILDAFDVDRERLSREKRISGIFIDESGVRIEGLKLTKKNILSHLKNESARGK